MTTSEGRLTWTNETRRLGDLRPQPDNPRQIKADQVKRLLESWQDYGQVETIAVGPDGEIYNGHQRLAVLLDKYGPEYEIAVRVASRPLAHKEWQRLTVILHRGAVGAWDWDTLANEFEVDDLLDWGFSEKELHLDLDLDGVTAGNEPEDEPGMTRADVPDAIFPTDNEYGIPLLKASLQPSMLVSPFCAWGEKAGARTRRISGTWHFYTEDYRFQALWSDPSPVLNSGCVAIVEPNFSCYTDMPMAVGLYRIYQKRWLARFWQEHGVKVLVDLNVAPPFAALNLLGVPHGWRAWATRGYAGRLEDTAAELAIAREHAGTDDLLFVVYGGGKAVRAWCQQHGVVWFPEQRDLARGRFTEVEGGKWLRGQAAAGEVAAGEAEVALPQVRLAASNAQSPGKNTIQQTWSTVRCLPVNSICRGQKRLCAGWETETRHLRWSGVTLNRNWS